MSACDDCQLNAKHMTSLDNLLCYVTTASEMLCAHRLRICRLTLLDTLVRLAPDYAQLDCDLLPGTACELLAGPKPLRISTNAEQRNICALHTCTSSSKLSQYHCLNSRKEIRLRLMHVRSRSSASQRSNHAARHLQYEIAYRLNVLHFCQDACLKTHYTMRST